MKRAIRLTASVTSTSCKLYSNELKIMTLPWIHICEILVHMRMSLNRLKLNLWFICIIQGTSLTYSLQVTTLNYLNSFTHNGQLIFNKLSNGIKTQSLQWNSRQSCSISWPQKFLLSGKNPSYQNFCKIFCSPPQSRFTGNPDYSSPQMVKVTEGLLYKEK